MDPNSGSTGNGDDQDLTSFVQDLLQQMQQRFEVMSDAIITRIDDMGNRIEGLEKSIADLMQQAGVEGDEVDAMVTSSDSKNALGDQARTDSKP